MDMIEYIERNGIKDTIAKIARSGPLAVLAELGPGPGECNAIEANGERPFHEVRVTLANGFIRRDFPVRERLAAMLAEEPTDHVTIEGADLRWQHVVIQHAGYVWRLRTYEGEIANDDLAEETSHRASTGAKAITHDEEQRVYAEALALATFDDWRYRLEEEPHWPNSTEALT